jgi:methyl-accepting chemotaxis protein
MDSIPIIVYATAVQETAGVAREIAETAQQVNESAPVTGEAIRNAVTGIRTKRSTRSS